MKLAWVFRLDRLYPVELDYPECSVGIFMGFASRCNYLVL
jgi:hypothetical protein